MEFFVWLILCNVVPLVVVAPRAITKAYKKAAKAKKQNGANAEEIERTKRFEIKKTVATSLLAGNAVYFLCTLVYYINYVNTNEHRWPGDRDTRDVMIAVVAISAALAYVAYHVREIIKANHQ